jgi:TonB family protein
MSAEVERGLKRTRRGLDARIVQRTRALRLLGVAGVLVVVLVVLAFGRWSDGPIADGDYVVKVAPTYPRAAFKAKIQGEVTVEITIGWNGRLLASSIKTSSGSTLLDDAALEAARESTYRVPTLDGIAIQRSFIVYYAFELDQ